MKKLIKKLIPDFLFSWYHFLLAFFGALIYGFPSRKLKVIGVTGTKGKSTVVMLLGNILNVNGNNSSQSRDDEPARVEAGQPPLNLRRGAGWISSVTINDGKEEKINPYHMTMPGRFFVQKSLAQMARSGCQYAILEVTSEGIKQHRHKFIKWAGAVFTNLAPEHLEAHGGYENYRAAKLKLFKEAAQNPASFGVYNLDDEAAGYFLEPEVKNKFGYILRNNFQFSISNFQSIFKFSKVQLKPNGSCFEIEGTQFISNLLGEFNVYNAAAAIVAAKAVGIDFEIAKKALEKIKSVPGRLELINEGQDFTVIVDFAHTPDSFEKVFDLMKKIKPPSAKIISVFGSAGGGRDKWKRPVMGKIGSENSDVLILTNEDPYDEDPGKIIHAVEAGCVKIKPEIVIDRREAIARALSYARTGDIILVLGKGTEQNMMVGEEKIPWDDRAIAKEILRKML